MFYRTKTGKISIDDTYMDYFSFGTGKRNLIMIQGLGIRGIKGTASATAFMYRIFAKEFRVYVFDRRDKVPDGFTNWDIADDIIYAMNQLGMDKASVFGVSQGGMIAQALAIKAPDKIEKIALGVTLSRPNETADRVISQWIAYAEKGDIKSINREMFTLLYSEDYLKKNRLLLPLAVKCMKPGDLKRFVTLARACITFDAYEQLGQMKCPVYVIGGRLDKVTTPEGAEEIARKLNCPIYMYEQYGHAAYDEAGDFNQKVLDFLK